MVYVMLYFFPPLFLTRVMSGVWLLLLCFGGRKTRQLMEMSFFFKVCWTRDYVFRLIWVGSFTSGEVGRDRPQRNLLTNKHSTILLKTLSTSHVWGYPVIFSVLCGTVKPSVWMSEDIAMCVEGSSCYTWRAEWCEQEVTRGFAVCGGFVNRSRGPALQLIQDFISQRNKRFPFRPLLSCPGGLCLRVTPTAGDGADYLIFFWRAKGKNRNCFLILSNRRRWMRKEGRYCLNVFWFFFFPSQWLCALH